jgi:HTH-type transcriptional regulator / antitoxin HipB
LFAGRLFRGYCGQISTINPNSLNKDAPGRLAREVSARRRMLGLRQAELAELAGTSARFVYDVERGKPSLRLDKLIDLLDILGLEIILSRKGEVTPREAPG